MKYKKGDKVLYKYYDRVDNSCSQCGHEDYDLVEKKKEAIIENVKQEYMFNVSNGFMITDEVITGKDGVVTHKPHLSDVKLTEKETLYKLNGDWYTVNALIKRTL